jgi:hypothetical protein
MVLNIIMLSSCHGSALSELQRGEVDLTLTSATEIEVKAADSSSEFDNYRFRFSGVDGYASSDFYTYGDVVMPMEWYYGLYTLYAESCTKEEAEYGYGCLRYEGESSQFAVINDQVSAVSVVCNVANSRVTVKFDDTMYESFANFKLMVRTVAVPLEDNSSDGDDPDSAEAPLQVIRTLELDPANPVGYYNVADVPVYMEYILYVKLEEDTDYIESVQGYFEEGGQKAVINSADAVVFNVRYIGTPVITSGIKFVVDGQRTKVDNSFTLDDYHQGGVKEDQ